MFCNFVILAAFASIAAINAGEGAGAEASEFCVGGVLKFITLPCFYDQLSKPLTICVGSFLCLQQKSHQPPRPQQLSPSAS